MSIKQAVYLMPFVFCFASTVQATVPTKVKECSSRNELNEHIKEGMVIVDAYAPWCGPCQKMGPTFDTVSNEITSVKFLKINAAQNGGLASSFPTLILYKDGKEVNRVVGMRSRTELINLIKSTFGL